MLKSGKKVCGVKSVDHGLPPGCVAGNLLKERGKTNEETKIKGTKTEYFAPLAKR